jgi:hypothetical protein
MAPNLDPLLQQRNICVSRTVRPRGRHGLVAGDFFWRFIDGLGMDGEGEVLRAHGIYARGCERVMIVRRLRAAHCPILCRYPVSLRR